MSERTIQRINLASFMVSLVTIVLGVIIAIAGVWGFIPRQDGLLWKILATDGIIFAGGVLTNLAIACYKSPGAHALQSTIQQ
jgi:hypothetical protein